jgi:hypothetical protein
VSSTAHRASGGRSWSSGGPRAGGEGRDAGPGAPAAQSRGHAGRGRFTGWRLRGGRRRAAVRRIPLPGWSARSMPSCAGCCRCARAGRCPPRQVLPGFS